MISHCPVSNLTPYARKMAIFAMEQRIRHAQTMLKQLQKNQKRGALWHEKEWRVDGSVLIPRRFFIWDDWHMSPYELIEDAQARIEELSL